MYPFTSFDEFLNHNIRGINFNDKQLNENVKFFSYVLYKNMNSLLPNLGKGLCVSLHYIENHNKRRTEIEILENFNYIHRIGSYFGGNSKVTRIDVFLKEFNKHLLSYTYKDYLESLKNIKESDIELKKQITELKAEVMELKKMIQYMTDVLKYVPGLGAEYYKSKTTFEESSESLANEL